jgi:hypothetical protein
MAWYKTGTLSITAGQTSVTGVGTQFASNARVGDGLRGPDGKWYEIVNIASETVLGIFPAYAGATVSASSDWVIAPIQGYVKESADRLRELINSLGYVDNPRIKSLAEAVLTTNSILIADSATTLAGLATGTVGRLLIQAENAAAARTAIGATTTGNALITAASAAAGRTALALGTAATANVTTSSSDNTSGRLLKVNDFGIGGTGVNITDANEIRVSGVYNLATVGGGGVNGPSQIGTVGWTIWYMASSSNQVSPSGYMIASPQTSVSDNKFRMFHRQVFGGTYSEWKEFADTDTVDKKLNGFGIGIDNQPTISDLNTMNPSGLYRGTSNTSNRPNNAPCTVLVMNYSSTSCQQLALLSDGSIYTRSTTDTGATWTAWTVSIRQGDFGIAAARLGDAGSGYASIYPSVQGNTSPSTFFALDSNAPQSEAHQPVAGEEFAGVGCSRALRPIQMGVSGRGSGAKFYFRGYSSSASNVNDWRQAADVNSPSFTGNPTAPNRPDRDSSTSIATTSFVEKTLGFAGIGENALNRNNIPSGTDLNNWVKPGIYGQTTNTNATYALNYPITTAGTLIVGLSGSAIVTQHYQQYNTGRNWTRSSYNGAWSPWLEAVTSGDIQSFFNQYGLGTNGPNITNLDDAIQGSIARFSNSATNIPLVGSSGVVFTMGYSTGATGYTTQLVITVQTSDANLYNRTFTRTRNQGNWGPWKEHVTMDNLTEVGILSDRAKLITDFNVVRATGIYQASTANSQASGLTIPAGHTMEHIVGTSPTHGHMQRAWPSTSNVPNETRVFRRGLWNNVWSDWVEEARLDGAIVGYTVGANSAIGAGDTLLGALGKIQGQLNAMQVTGSNGNGYYVRFNDGTQICIGSFVISNGALNAQASTTANWPSPFAATPYVTYSPYSAQGTGSQADIGLNNYNGIYAAANNNSCVFSCYRYRSATSNPVTYHYQAIGRWK